MSRTTHLALFSALALTACGGGTYDTATPTSPTPPTTPSTSTSITVADNSFSPSATTVPAGSTITWTWNGARQHNVTFDNNGGASTSQSSGTFTKAFTTAGTYNYHCTIHGAAMSGTITVQ